jgi:hypothetical protein
MEHREQHPGDDEPGDPALANEVVWRYWNAHTTDMAGMTEREEEEFFLAFGTRKERKAIKERRKARERARNQKS